MLTKIEVKQTIRTTRTSTDINTVMHVAVNMVGAGHW